MRLIDENVLLEEVEKLPFINERYDHEHANKSFINGIETFHVMVLNVLKRQPTIAPENLRPQWIPVAERLPEDCDERFYMCVVENHESDPPMYLQYLENTGFGLWSNVFDEHTLGFVGSDFSTNEELGYEKVLAWMPLPEPYTPAGEENADV